MKRLLCLLIVMIMCISILPSNILAAEDINITINGKLQNYDVMPVIVDGRTLVPMRAIFESLGAKVGWIDRSKTVTGTRNNKTVKLRIDSNLAYVDGVETILDVPATIINGRTMVPVRFISEMLGESVEWDGTTKTVKIDSDFVKNVAIQKTLAPLTNNIHRDIPNEFKTSSSFDDIEFYGCDYNGINFLDEKEFEDAVSKSKVLYDMDSLYNTSCQAGEETATKERVVIDNEDVIRFTLNKNLSATSGCIYNFKKLENFKEGDTLLLRFDVRVVESTNQKHYIQVQLQEKVSGKHKKIIWEKIFPSKEWKSVFIPVTAQTDFNDFGFRPGMYKGIVEVKNFSLINIGEVSAEQLRFMHLPADYEHLMKDAPWRKEALDRIETSRKGNFKVIVKDKDGNVVPDANVEFDMFESEYKFGTAINTSTTKDKKLQESLGKYFNTAVHTHHMKWGPYEQNPANARKQLDVAKKAGIKSFRGHALVWEKALSTDKTSYLLPKFVLKEDNTVIDDKEALQKYIKDWIYKATDDFAGEIDEWDVVNEIAEKFLFRGTHGDDMMIDWFKWANEGDPEGLMVYNDFAHMYKWCEGDLYENLLKYSKYFKDNNVDIDAVGFQSHMELYDSKNKFRLNTPQEHYDVFKTFADMGYKTSVTEYSMDNKDQYYQAEYTRDYYILAFSVPENYGFTMWGYADTSAFASESIMFDENWNMELAGEQLVDLVYNKFWTRDAKATTDSEGKASIRGFYGDYDVTVTANGKTKTISCAYHQGYENVLEFVLD